MNAPLLVAVKDELVGRGWAVLRFNFRGIGESEGQPGTGMEEVADARGALQALRENAPDVPVAIAGWSFGAAVAVRAAADTDDLVACAAIAPSVKPKAGVSDGLPAPEELSIKIPILFVCGAKDDVVSPDDCRKWIESVPAGAYEEIGGANHFFWAKYDVLSDTLGDWLDDQL